MASLASYAAPFDNEEESSSTQPAKKVNAIQQKRQKNKTMKRRDIENSNTSQHNTKNPKLEAMMNAIISSTKPQSNDNEHEDDYDDEDGNGNMGNFQPLPPPLSASAQRLNNGTGDSPSGHPLLPQAIVQNPDINKNIKNTETFTQLPGSLSRQYQQQYIPYYNQSSDDLSPNGANRDELLEKLHQIIYMLEEHKNNKNANSTEEIILYFFLGIFIIFIVDSFARVGKYVR